MEENKDVGKADLEELFQKIIDVVPSLEDADYIINGIKDYMIKEELEEGETEEAEDYKTKFEELKKIYINRFMTGDKNEEEKITEKEEVEEPTYDSLFE